MMTYSDDLAMLEKVYFEALADPLLRLRQPAAYRRTRRVLELITENRQLQALLAEAHAGPPEPKRATETAFLRWFYAHSPDEEQVRLTEEFARSTGVRLPADYEYELAREED